MELFVGDHFDCAVEVFDDPVVFACPVCAFGGVDQSDVVELAGWPVLDVAAGEEVFDLAVGAGDLGRLHFWLCSASALAIFFHAVIMRPGGRDHPG